MKSTQIKKGAQKNADFSIQKCNCLADKWANLIQ